MAILFGLVIMFMQALPITPEKSLWRSNGQNFDRYSFSTQTARVIQSQNGVLWVGTPDGLFKNILSVQSPSFPSPVFAESQDICASLGRHRLAEGRTSSEMFSPMTDTSSPYKNAPAGQFDSPVFAESQDIYASLGRHHPASGRPSYEMFSPMTDDEE